MCTFTDILDGTVEKTKCPNKNCPSTTYWNGHDYLCVICDHQAYEYCPDCMQLLGWCHCVEGREPYVPVVEEAKIDSARDQIIDILEGAGGPMRRGLLLQMVDGKAPVTVDKTLDELRRNGEIQSPSRGLWSLA